MLKNWIIVAWRNIGRQRVTSILNTSGLSLGITGSLVLFLMINHLVSIDQYHSNADKIYRLVQETYREGEVFNTQGIQAPLPDAFREDFKKISTTTYISDINAGVLIGIHDRDLGMQYHEVPEGVAYAENSFFNVFDRQIINGNKEKVLLQPNEVILSEKLATQLFPDGSALGKEIEINKNTNMVIVGVMEDYPDNTDFPFEIFISFETVKSSYLERGWTNINSDDQFYFLLPESLTVAEVEERMVDFKKKYFEENEFENRTFYAQPLKDLHFDTRYGTYSEKTVDRSNLYAMAIVGFFLILTGCINYINLSTAVAMKRAKEVGVRKVLGGNRWIIVQQFLSETFIITFIAIVIALGLTELLLQFINPLLKLNLSVQLLTNATIWIYLISLVLFITLLAGLYPAFVLSGFKPAEVLKKIISHKSSSGYQLRRALVVFQFVISQIFIIGTVIVLLQMDFIEQKDMGFTSEAILNVNLPVKDTDKAEAFKNHLLNSSSVRGVTLANATPASGNTSITSINYGGKQYLSMMKAADEKYTELFDLNILAGRNLIPSDTIRELVVNEQFVKELGFNAPEEIIGVNIDMWGRQIPVVGVVNDFHANSLREKIRPLMLFTNKESYGLLSAKISSNNLNSLVTEFEAVHKNVYPEYAMEYEFFEDDIASFYEGERKMASVLGVFSLVAIFIGCIGLYGLISYVTQQKIKEVGIRKVLGASVNNIMMIFSKEFIILILIAFVIAAPLAGLGMGEWLNSFQYKIDLGFQVYLAGIILTLLIALITVGYKTYKAATSNPVESLNNE
ncbi:MAG: ABC transporter permease [Candidatus Cyclobacteriaceae bacterium M2_1C_046]